MSKTFHFLYVEDDETNRQVIELLLPYWGQEYTLTIFEDSSNFMDKLTALSPSPDVIFLDIHMKPLSGFEMLKLIRTDESFAGTTVIAVTASVMNDEINKLKTAGFDGTIAKPINRSIFPDLLSRICKGEKIWHVN